MNDLHTALADLPDDMPVALSAMLVWPGMDGIWNGTVGDLRAVLRPALKKLSWTDNQLRALAEAAEYTATKRPYTFSKQSCKVLAEHGYLRLVTDKGYATTDKVISEATQLMELMRARLLFSAERALVRFIKP